MTSRTEICNLAISHFPGGQPITGTTNEDNTVEKKACDTYYDIARRKILTDINWYFPRKVESLGLIIEKPNNQWAYSYSYPSDCIQTIRVLSGYYPEQDETKVNFVTGIHGGIKCIFTDKVDAQLEYISDLEDTDLFPIDFIIAFSYLLAFFISPKIKNITDENMLKMYEVSMASAKAKEFRSQNETQKPVSKFVQARNSTYVQYPKITGV